MSSDKLTALVVQPEARKLLPVPNGPRLSNAAGEVLRKIEIVDEHGRHRSIHVPVERPLTISLDGRELVTLMTLGASPEWLVTGWLRNQRLLSDVTLLESVTVDWQSGVAFVKTREGAPREGEATRLRGTACSLGTAFGDLMNIEAEGTPFASVVAQIPAAGISRTTLLAVLEIMRQHDAIHRAAGSVHSCALFRDSDLWVSVEDVSRHNGVDSITGWMALHAVPGHDKILFTTGRLTGEMVLKAAYNGLPILVSRNGVTAKGYDLATGFGMSLFGRAAKRRFICYTGAERFDAEASSD